jgi:leucyl aminopeptidase (aminopeptidase T)
MTKTVFKPSVPLMKAANIAIREVLAVKESERVLIITNPEKEVFEIAQAMYLASLNAKASPTLVAQQKKNAFDYAEPSVINAIKTEPPVIMMINADRTGKDKEALANPYKGKGGETYSSIFDYLLYEEKKIRAFWSPKVTLDMFMRTVPLDYGALRKRCARIATELQNASEVHVRTALGTDVVIGIGGRRARVDDGNFGESGKGGNLPAGEVFISPKLGASHGVIVFDGSITLDETVVIKKPVKVEIERGFVAKIEGGEEAERLKKFIEGAEERPFEMMKNGELDEQKAGEYSRNARHVGELGIGANPRARIVGNVLEDEKVLGTVHFAIGSNYDHDAPALIHSDGIVKAPTITVDGKLLTP